MYLNYCNIDTKNIIDGSSKGLQFEWTLHNIIYYMSLGNADLANDVDVGCIIFNDAHQ